MNIKLRYIKYSLPILIIVLLVVLAKFQNQAICTITPAVLNTPEVSNSSVDLSWKNGQNSKVTYLNVSTSDSINSDGSFTETAGIVNDIVTDRNSYLKSNLKPGTYYWNIVSDGCKKRKVSELGNFTIQDTSDTNCKIKPAILNKPVVEDSKVTLSWSSDLKVEVTYINVSTSNMVNTQGILQKLDVANDIVSGKKPYVKENLSPGIYYWNVINDSCGQRKVSELGNFTIQ